MTTALFFVAGIGAVGAWTLLVAKIVAGGDLRLPFGRTLRLAWLPVGLLLAATMVVSTAPIAVHLLATRADETRRSAALTAFVDQYKDSGRGITLEGFNRVDAWAYQFTNAGSTYLAVKIPAGWIETELLLEGDSLESGG